MSLAVAVDCAPLAVQHAEAVAMETTMEREIIEDNRVKSF